MGTSWLGGGAEGGSEADLIGAGGLVSSGS